MTRPAFLRRTIRRIDPDTERSEVEGYLHFARFLSPAPISDKPVFMRVRQGYVSQNLDSARDRFGLSEAPRGANWVNRERSLARRRSILKERSGGVAAVYAMNVAGNCCAPT